MRREELYLRDIVEAADHISDFSTFEGSELVRSAVVQKFAIVGEAGARLSAGMRMRYPDVPWQKIAAFRNILVHAYFGLDWSEIWRAATVQAPELRARVVAILADEFE
jgi:uncharacterized protein with HEPN domain